MDADFEPTWTESSEFHAAVSDDEPRFMDDAFLSSATTDDWRAADEQTLSLNIERAQLLFGHYVDTGAYEQALNEKVVASALEEIEEQHEVVVVAATAGDAVGGDSRSYRKRRRSGEPCDCLGCRKARAQSDSTKE
jgi:hypothetical protein